MDDSVLTRRRLLELAGIAAAAASALAACIAPTGLPPVADDTSRRDAYRPVHRAPWTVRTGTGSFVSAFRRAS